MRKYFIVLASLAVAGCMVSEISEETVYVNVDYPTYTAAFDDEGTKVYVDTDLKMHWNAGDEISIFRTTGNQRYSFDGADGDREGTFSVQGDPQGGSELQTAYAVYPYSDNTSINTDGVITLNLPEVQHYAENSFGQGANTMVAVTESKDSDKLYFKNLCGYLVVKLYGEGTIKSITLTGNNGEKLSGQATVAPIYGEAPVLTMSESAGTSITLDCGEGVALESTAENATAFWVAVPPVTFSNGFTVTVTTDEASTITKRMGVERTVERNVEHSLAAVKVSPLRIAFDSADLVVMPANATRDIHYSITSEPGDITVEAYASGNVEATVEKNDSYSGVIRVTTGSVIDETCKVVVLVSNGNQAIMRTLTFEEEAIAVEENTTKEVSDAGGEVTLEFFSNMECHVEIPEVAKSWISVVPITKAMTKQTITLAVEENIGLPRSAIVQVVGDDEVSSIVLSYTISQEVGGVWKEGTVPPDNEIWYVTSDETISTYFNSLDYLGCQVVSNLYSNGKGVVKFNDKLTYIVATQTALWGDVHNRIKISNLFLPETIKVIGDEVFSWFGIHELRIPRDLQAIGKWVFNDTCLSCFTGNNVSPDGHLLIMDDIVVASALYGVEQYTFPDGLYGIGDFACAYNNTLKEIHLLEGIKYIGQDAFSFCPALAGEIYLPNSLDYIGYHAFGESYGITGYYGNPKFTTSDHLCLINDNVIIAFTGREIESYTIPEGITGIDNHGMVGAIKLRQLVLPETLDFIGGLAFLAGGDGNHDCLNLEEFQGAHVTKDGKGFIKDGVLHCVVPKCPIDYKIPEGTRSIQNQCFVNHCDVERIVCNDEIETIGDYAFGWCLSLKEIVLSKNLQSFSGYEPFAGCCSLERIYFRSYLPPSYSDTQTGDELHEGLTIYVPEETFSLYKRSPQWSQYSPYMVGYHYDDIGEWNPDYYISNDMSHDGEAIALQQSTLSDGIDLVLMGDGFSDRQIADGTYANVMKKAMDAFFSEEPYKSFKERFNVSYVNVVSITEGYDHAGQALGTGFGDGADVYGNDDKVIEYAKEAISEDKLDDAVIIVMMNRDYYAGTCYMYYPEVSSDYGHGLSIAYFPTSSDTDTFNGLVSHEAGGHGFAKLADEYAYEYMGAVPADKVGTTRNETSSWGWWKNVDFTGDPTQVRWAQFIADPRYAAENIGCYEGAFTYWTGAWRPTENSIMRYNTGGFNAPSRYAIWYRINKLAYGDSWNGTYEDFVEYDAVNRTPAAVARRNARRNCVEKNLPPLAPPVVVGHSWRDAK